jgi:carbamoyltransferase
MRDVIGISLGYNTSACVVNPKEGIKLAISEERLNGEKNTKKFPLNALTECVKSMKIPSRATLYIAICSYEVINERTYRYFDDSDFLVSVLRAESKDFWEFLGKYIRIKCNIADSVSIVFRRAEHHEAHMLPALYMSGFPIEETISITYDGFGDGVSGTIIDHSTNQILAREQIETSLGLVYQYVTGALGFKEHQHEGKITGLAAFGEPKYKDLFEDLFIGYDEASREFIPNYLLSKQGAMEIQVPELNNNIHGFNNMFKLKNRIYSFIDHLFKNVGATKEDIAATVQEYTEDLISRWALDIITTNKIPEHFNIVLSGGVFSNVKLNFKIKKVLNPENLFVLPPMGDEGTAIGAAISLIKEVFGEKAIDREKFGQDKLYLGTVEPKKKLQLSDINKKKYTTFEFKEFADKDIILMVAEFLSMNKIVCVSRGYSEFGPRALGNHSILYDASEKETNDSLNKRLNRTEFMPFAPITIDKFANDLFEDMEGLEKTLKYMTISVPVTQEFADNYKAAYHVDFTARPQVLSKLDNTVIYDIINLYFLMTGRKALINTSFNLHNAPIIYDEHTAYESFVKADLDVLFLRDKLIVKRGR